MKTLYKYLTYRFLVFATLLLATIGLVDASYLAYARFTHTTISCTVLEGCNIVAASPYSVLFGIAPLAYLGLLFYIGIIVIALFLVRYKHIWIQNLLVLGGAAGAASSLYFIYLQAFKIHAFCIYCIISAIVSVLVLGTTILLRWGTTHTAHIERAGTSPEPHQDTQDEKVVDAHEA